MNYHNPETPKDGMIDLRLGHTLEKLRELPDEAVQCIVTSPPYWGLRAYGTDPQVWLNGHEPCAVHQWELQSEVIEFGRTRNALPNDLTKERGHGRSGIVETRTISRDTCALCGAWRGELGLEPTPELYVEHLTQIFREARRVLRDDGTLWLNLGDSYASNWGMGAKRDSSWWSNRSGDLEGKGWGTVETAIPPNSFKGKNGGLKVKDLIGIPWRVAFALQADGWYLRSEIIWHKPNPMPESVTDRPTKAHEQVFLLAKSARYYYDADAIREPLTESSMKRDQTPRGRKQNGGGSIESMTGIDYTTELGDMKCNEKGRNKRSVWTVTTHPFKEAHFATFPPKLIEPMILAGCPVGGVVLDPFNGSGTTGLVATQLGRDYIGIELKPEYVEMTKRRLESVQIKAIG